MSRGERRFDLFHARSVAQVEDAGDLRQVPAQAAGEFGATDALLPHRFVESNCRHPQRRERHDDLAGLRLGSVRQRFLSGNLHRECGFERIFRTQKHYFAAVAFRDRLGHVAERDGEAAVGIGG